MPGRNGRAPSRWAIGPAGLSVDDVVLQFCHGCRGTMQVRSSEMDSNPSIQMNNPREDACLPSVLRRWPHGCVEGCADSGAELRRTGKLTVAETEFFAASGGFEGRVAPLYYGDRGEHGSLASRAGVGLGAKAIVCRGRPAACRSGPVDQHRIRLAGCVGALRRHQRRALRMRRRPRRCRLPVQLSQPHRSL